MHGQQNVKKNVNYMFRPILFLATIRLDKIIGENYTIYNMIQYNNQCWCVQVDEISFTEELEGVCVCVCVCV